MFPEVKRTGGHVFLMKKKSTDTALIAVKVIQLQAAFIPGVELVFRFSFLFYFHIWTITFLIDASSTLLSRLSNIHLLLCEPIAIDLFKSTPFKSMIEDSVHHSLQPFRYIERLLALMTTEMHPSCPLNGHYGEATIELIYLVSLAWWILKTFPFLPITH